MADGTQLDVLGVPVTDMTMDEALALMEGIIRSPDRHARSIFFVNAHTLNVAWEDAEYRTLLGRADHVFGDGTGVRWAVRALHGQRIRDNVNGTDLVPLLFATRAHRGYRYYLLGNTEERIGRAAAYAERTFSGWEQVGHHHGYLDGMDQAEVVETINASNADMLLVAMGNPKQEQWIDRWKSELRVPLCMGIGGLFDYWSGDLTRAPAWMRKVGYEWAHLLMRQPHKARRYLVGNPQFLLRVAQARVLGAGGEA
ncbi:MAG: WecB/TagA/CpsF family glycosyltransferase [Myxococcales bacterium]|nr:WecB/TagA/CpsF family glycosyltransferase [Myxococcales bacterium]